MDGDLRAQGDPARIGEVLSKLLNNATQYGTAGLPITLSARGECDIVVIDVKNQGPAIPADALQVIFNPLVQMRTEHDGPADPAVNQPAPGLVHRQHHNPDTRDHERRLAAELQVQACLCPR